MFWTSSRLRRFLKAFVSALFISCILSIYLPTFNINSKSTLINRGDFTAFYSAATIISQGKFNSLYSPKLHLEIQNEHWPDLENTYNFFPYPPYVAVLLSPLAFFDANVAKAFTTISMLMLLFIIAYIASKKIPNFCSSTLIVYALILSFSPGYISIIAAQNSMISLFLLLCFVLFFSKNTPLTDLLSGACLGFWLFKPQYPLIILIFLLVSKRWKVFVGFSVIAAIYYLLGVYVMGVSWPFKWYQSVSLLSYDSVNQHQFVSIYGFFKALSALYSDYYVILNLCCVMTIAYVVLQAISLRKNLFTLDGLFLFGPLVVLLSPHSMNYDLAIVSVSVLRFIDFRSDKQISVLILAILFATFVESIKHNLPISPLFVLSFASFLFVRRGIVFRLK